MAGGGISARRAVRVTGGHARIGAVRTMTGIGTNVAAALARGGTSSVGTTRRVAYAATDISRISDAVRAVTRMSCVRTEISGATEAIRSVANAARIAAAEGASALVRSLSAHAGIATANARADELIGTARLTVSVGRAVIQVGRVLPVLNTEKIVIVPVRRETIGVPRIVWLSRRLPATCCSRLGREVVTRRGTIGATAAGTTCGFDRMILAVRNLVGITGLDIHMIQALLVATSVRIDLVRRGTEIVARTGKYLVRIDGLLLRNSLRRCTALTHTVVAYGSSGRAASSTVARSPTVGASSRGAGGRGTSCRGAMSASYRCAGSGGTMCASRGCAGCWGSVGASRGRSGVTWRARGGSVTRTVSGTTGIRIHKRIVVSTVRRAGGRRRGSRVTAGIASGGRMRRRGGLSGTGYTVRAVTRISGRKSRILDIPATVRGVAGVACRVGGVPACVCGVAGVACCVGGVPAGVCGVAGVACCVGGVAACVCGVAGATSRVSGVAARVCSVAGVACCVGGVAARVRGVASATSRIGGTADTMGSTTCTVRGMACTAGEATATGRCVSCTARTAGDTAAARSGVRGVASATGSIGGPADCVCGVAGIPEGPTRPRCAAYVTDPVQGASHAVGGMSGVVSVVGCSGQVLCGVRQIRDVRGGIQTVGAQLADHVLAELRQRTNIVGANRQDSLDDLFADAKGASRAGQGLLTGRHASTTAHGHNRHDHVGQKVANGAGGIIGPRIPVQQ